MADLYSMCENMDGVLSIGRCINTSVPIFMPITLSVIWVIILISSFRSMGSLPRALLNSSVIFWILSSGFFAAGWVYDYWIVFATVALAASGVYAYSQRNG